MSVVERAINRLQKKGVPTSTRNQQPVAKVNETSQMKALPEGSIPEAQEVPNHGRIVEFSIEALNDAGLYHAGNTRIADEYRLIRRPILKKASESREQGNAHGNLVMVTSALAGEGKTFSSVNLSLSLAREQDWEVLLVDVDCRNPQLSRLLGVEEEPGLMDLLKDDTLDLNSVILPTNVRGLSVLPLGGIDENAAEYLASSRMSALCDQLSMNVVSNRIVIFDSSPLLMTAESPILSALMGQVVLVVSANATPRQAVVESISKLDDDGRAVGMILNRVDRSGDVAGYGTYQAYGYPE